MLYSIREHKIFSGYEAEEIKELHLDFSFRKGDVNFLGLSPNLQTGYYIGVDWLKEGEAAIQVNPKIQGLDYITMFMECFKAPEISDELFKIYKIHIDKPAIEIDSNHFEITPLLIIHFLNIMKSLVRKGLKKDYIRKEENLNSKFKGKLLFNQHLKNNIIKNRYDRNYCGYQNYSIDCLENRILKKTLQFVYVYINKYYKQKELLSNLNYCYSAFEYVSEEVEITEIKKIKINPLFKEYAEALRLAKMILKRFSYSINEVNKDFNDKVPPFWIDMSLLFECYVLGKLKEKFGSSIKYQAQGKYGAPDFLELKDKIILDTKYKLIYNDEKYEIENIRQISGYARDKGILKKLNVENDNIVVDCVIIYPNADSKNNFTERQIKEGPIKQFQKFYKIGIRLPVYKDRIK